MVKIYAKTWVVNITRNVMIMLSNLSAIQKVIEETGDSIENKKFPTE